MLTWCKTVDLLSGTAKFRKTRPTGFISLSVTVTVVDEDERAWGKHGWELKTKRRDQMKSR